MDFVSGYSDSCSNVIPKKQNKTKQKNPKNINAKYHNKHVYIHTHTYIDTPNVI